MQATCFPEILSLTCQSTKHHSPKIHTTNSLTAAKVSNHPFQTSLQDEAVVSVVVAVLVVATIVAIIMVVGVSVVIMQLVIAVFVM